MTESLEELAKVAVDQNPDREVQGAALYLLATGYQKAADFAATLDVLDLTVDDYIALMYPDITDDQKALFEGLRRWQAGETQVLRRQARRYLDVLSKEYSKVKLFSPYVNEEGRFVSREMGRIGKKAKSADLALQNASVGQPLAELNVKDLEGNPVTLTDHAGKVVILYFWSSTCGPCRKSMPYYREIAEQLKGEGKPFQMITLSVDDNQEELDLFMQENSMPFINCRIGKNNRLLHEWGVDGFPTGMLIDQRGVVSAKGQLSKDFLQSVTAKKLQEGIL